MRLKNAQFGDILWGSLEYTGKNNGIGKNDIPFLVIDPLDDSVYVVAGTKTIGAEKLNDFKGIKAHILSNDYYFDLKKIDEVRYEFFYRYQGILTYEEKLLAIKKIQEAYNDKKIKINSNKGSIFSNSLNIEEVLISLGVDPESLKTKEEPKTTIQVDTYGTDTVTNIPNSISSYNEFDKKDAGKQRVRTNKVEK